MKTLSLLLIVLSTTIFVGCSKRGESEQIKEEKTAVQPMELIVKKGVYKFEASALSLSIFEDADGTIDYKLTDASGAVLIKAKKTFNPLMRWGMIFDEKQKLWVHSSDVGIVLWEKNDSGVYVDKDVTEEDAKEIPKPLFDMLPNSLKKMWK